MDRETILNFCNNKQGNTTLIAVEIISAYCEEMGKKSEDISKFIQALYSFPMLISGYLNVALSYYKRKYVIFDLYQGNVHLLTY